MRALASPWSSTIERCYHCVLLQVIGEEFDRNDLDDRKYFETVYMMLDSLSPLYRNSFGNSLATKLAKLATEGKDKLSADEATDPATPAS